MSRARLYRRLPIFDSDVWWLELAANAPDQRVLELGAGAGRLTEALAAAGYHVTAVDRDPGMLAALRGRGLEETGRVEVVDSDISSLPDLGEFGLVILPSSLLNELPDADVRAEVLSQAARRCRADGAVALHVLGPWWLVRLPDQAYGELQPSGGAPSIEVSIEGQELEPFGSRRRARLSYRFPDGELLTDHLDAAIITPEELSAALMGAGLELVETYGATPPAPLLPDDAAWHLLARPS